jgi:hypothetical protein
MRTRVKRTSRMEFRCTDELRAEINAAADEEGRTASSVTERVMIDWAAQRLVAREQKGGK